MAIAVSYPGVYIEEFEPAAPIQGVGTSTAAFLGLNAFGPPNEPTFLTSWDAYQQKFAAPAPVKPEDDDYLWYAVRGYFANGGKICYVTAVSNASPDSVVLNDEGGQPTVTVTARRSGKMTPPIEVLVAAENSVTGVQLFAPLGKVAKATKNSKSFEVKDVKEAAQFLAGDDVEISDSNNRELAKVARASGKVVFLTDGLQDNYNAAKLTLAPLAPFATSFRVTDPAGRSPLVVGSIIALSQGGVANPQTTVITAIRAERISPTLTTYRVTVKDGLSNFTLDPTKPIKVQSEEFRLEVRHGSVTSPPYAGLSMEPSHPRYFASIINNDPTGLIRAQQIEPPNTTALPANRPTVQVAGTPVQLANGVDHDPATIKSRASDYENILARLKSKKDINIIVVPDRTDVPVQSAVLAHCASLYDRFAIFDSIKGTQIGDIDIQRESLENDKGFGALYYPWIEVTSEKTGNRLLVPPSGHIAGIYARTDLNRGVFKAPAGTEAIINGALGVEEMLSDDDQGVLNKKRINVIRVFRNGGRPVVWGARTTCENVNWQYVNIRRLFLFLEQSIQVGIRGSVFESNIPPLWQKLKRTITAFLTQQWRDGALFGARVEDAFYVRIDDALNPDNERALGRLYIEIGVRPSYPAEFIIVRIGIWQGGSEVSD